MEVEFIILPNGQIQVIRSGQKIKNDYLYHILKDVVEDVDALKIFLEDANSCQQLVGDEPLCG